MKQPNTQYSFDEIMRMIEDLDNITILYARLSKEDTNKKDESYSIQNQKVLLEQCAKDKELTNTLFLCDDGLSGVFFDTREGISVALALIEKGKVGVFIIKDLSRLGRNYRESGNFTEQIFPHYNIRFIAIGDGIDQRNEYQKVRLNTGLDINIAIKNLMNENYVQDLSNKLRLAQAAKSSRGYAIGHPPYGYMYGEEDKRRWVIDEDAAEVVKLIYALRLEGLSCEKICVELARRKILIPAAYAISKGKKSPNGCERGEYYWNTPTVTKILKNQSYVGDIINFKTYTLSYKDRTKHKNEKENWEVHENAHEPIIDRAIWKKVQRSFKRNCRVPAATKEKHILAGYLVCSDCGANLAHKHLKDKPRNDYFSCGNNRRMAKLCADTHHIRVDDITRLVTSSIANVVRFVQDFEDDFVKLVVDSKYKEIKLQQARNKRQLGAAKARDAELNILYERIYEDKVNGTLTGDRFLMLSRKYDDEQRTLKTQIRHLQKQVDEDAAHEINAEGFVEMVRKYTSVSELTPEILREFIDKVVVHHRLETKEGRVQQVDIYFNMVGMVQLPERKERELYSRSFSRTKKENHIAEAI